MCHNFGRLATCYSHKINRSITHNQADTISLKQHNTMHQHIPSHSVNRRPRSNSDTSQPHTEPKRRRHPRKHRTFNDSSSCGDSSTSSGEHPSPQQQVRDPRRQHDNKKKKADAHFPPPSDYVALDCEMVGLGPDGHISAVARVTLIDWNANILLDEYLHFDEDTVVTDYRTFVSGVTADDLINARMTLSECRNQVLQFLENKILVGHALKNDLRALDISHPWWLTRDTAKYEPFMQVRFDDGVFWPRKLKELAHEKLHQEIQVPDKPHSPYEDALAALDLYQTVRTKWERLVSYKINKTREIEQQQLRRVAAQ
jgi:RNA exonuclease 4